MIVGLIGFVVGLADGFRVGFAVGFAVGLREGPYEGFKLEGANGFEDEIGKEVGPFVVVVVESGTEVGLSEDDDGTY